MKLLTLLLVTLLLSSCDRETYIFPKNCTATQSIKKDMVTYYNQKDGVLKSTAFTNLNAYFGQVFYYSIKDTLFTQVIFYPYTKTITKYFWNDTKTELIVMHKSLDSINYSRFTAKVENNRITSIPMLFSINTADSTSIRYSYINDLKISKKEIYETIYEYYDQTDSIGYANQNELYDKAIIKFFGLWSNNRLIKSIVTLDNGTPKDTTNYTYIRDANQYIKYKIASSKGKVDTTEFVYSCDF